MHRQIFSQRTRAQEFARIKEVPMKCGFSLCDVKGARVSRTCAARDARA
jgi:hypothetical protein